MTASSWFKTHQIDDHCWAIDDHGIDVIYLLTGSERALLIDTGMGIGDLAGLVNSLTALPLIVVNTHGHVDHVSGNGQFAQVYIGAEDLDAVTEPWSAEDRAVMQQHFFSGDTAPEPPPGFVLSDWCAKVAEENIPIHAGYVFDLGGREIEALAIPGHTPGSLAYLDHQSRRLFTGDAVLGGVWMQLNESTPLSVFHQSLVDLLSCRDRFDLMYCGHRVEPFPAEDLPGFTAGVARILAGELTGQPETTFAGDGLRWMHNSLGVLYRPDRLH